ncbi:MAG: hypothetical protein U0Z53_26460 [Blastocatellia bacterium]
MKKIDRTGAIFILAGTSSQYTVARQMLKLAPGQAFWLTRPSDLDGLRQPKVYRFGTWQTLTRLQEIEAALKSAEADISDL